MLREHRTSQSTNSASTSAVDSGQPVSPAARFVGDFGFRPMSSRRRMGQSEPQYASRPVLASSGSETPSREAQAASRPAGVTEAKPAIGTRPDADCARSKTPTIPDQVSSDSNVDSRARAEVLERLRDAAEIAKRHNHSVWDFAIEISELIQSGTHILRELICQGLVEHRRESATELDHRARRFTPEPELVLSDRSCFVITAAGLKYLQRETSTAINEQVVGGESKTETDRADLDTGVTIGAAPRWDEEKRELWVGPYLIKRFRWPAPNQLVIVREFHRLNWPPRIPDPLPQSNDVDAKQRLHDTIKCLNRRRVNKLLKFGGDGTGIGVVFHITPEEK